MHETQQTIGSWAKSTFPGGDALSPRHCLRLLEEVVELCLVAGAKPMAIDQVTDAALAAVGVLFDGPAQPEPVKVPEELADCVIVLAVLAERRGIDLQAEVNRKMSINRARRWKLNGDGTGYHIKDNEAIP